MYIISVDDIRQYAVYLMFCSNGVGIAGNKEIPSQPFINFYSISFEIISIRIHDGVVSSKWLYAELLIFIGYLLNRPTSATKKQKQDKKNQIFIHSLHEYLIKIGIILDRTSYSTDRICTKCQSR